jgi:hypothetical protein
MGWMYCERSLNTSPKAVVNVFMTELWNLKGEKQVRFEGGKDVHDFFNYGSDFRMLALNGCGDLAQDIGDNLTKDKPTLRGYV